MTKSRFANVWTFFAATFAVSWLVWLPVIHGGGEPKALLALGAFAPSLMGVLFTYLTKDQAARKDFWRRTLSWPRVHPAWIISGLLILPLLEVVSAVLPALFGGSVPSLGYAVEVLRNPAMLIELLFVEITFGAVSEELGWRGFALDELQRKWSALKSSLVLGFIWAVWHTPAFLIPGTSQYAMGGIFSPVYIAFLLAVPAGSVLHTWVYNNTKRSILVAGVLMHFTRNLATILMAGIFDSFSMPIEYWLALPIVYLLAVVVVTTIWGPQTLTRKQDSATTQQHIALAQ